MSRPKARALLLASSLALLAAGCTSSPKLNASTASATPMSASASGSPSPTGSGPPGTGAAASGSNGDLPVLGSRRTAAGARTVQVDLNQVRASGQVMEVTFTARNAGGSGNGNDGWQISDFFSNGITDSTSQATADAFTVDGVYVIDPVNAKRYLVARDANGVCVCSGGLSSTFAGAGQGVVLTAAFKAPPADVSSVDVVIPKAGTFAGVTVQR